VSLSEEIEAEEAAVSDEIKERNRSNISPDVYLVGQGRRGLRIASDIKREVVARDGIEPPTRGFSVLCSTD
jgi:pyrimidine operon attenuation protein/uracil phosphoribosyltransferase